MPAKKEIDLVVENIEADVCVVGGGMSGICAAIASARNGAKTVLVQDRPVLGGNASSEVRMWICGAHGTDQKEAGILEEILLENLYRNPGLKYTIWDHILYSKVQHQENLTLLLNTSVVKTFAEDNCIKSVKAWQLTTQKWLDIKAKIFVDSSGDSILRYCGAEFYRGRESQSEFNESLTVEEADECTMGNSILIQLREVDEHVPFIPPEWAYHYTEEDLPKRTLKTRANNNFWWLEIGGMQDTIGDAETIRDELFKMAYGVWDCIKNNPDGSGYQWELEWIGSLPGKRENIRYKGDKVLCQNDVSSGGKFDDMVAYGGWSMDDHHPEGINYKGAPTIFHKAPSPYGIPLSCLYSSNIKNLMFAGRNISTTHMALSSTRVMATCAIIGQAVGIAAAMAQKYCLSPKEIRVTKIKELQELLLDQDCYLPGLKRENNKAISVKLDKDAQDILSNGVDRSLGDEDNGLWLEKGETIEINLGEAKEISGIRLIHDSNFKDTKRQPCSFPKKSNQGVLPEMMLKEYQVNAYSEVDQKFYELVLVQKNVLRLDIQSFKTTTTKLQLKAINTWGNSKAHIFALDVF